MAEHRLHIRSKRRHRRRPQQHRLHRHLLHSRRRAQQQMIVWSVRRQEEACPPRRGQGIGLVHLPAPAAAPAAAAAVGRKTAVVVPVPCSLLVKRQSCDGSYHRRCYSRLRHHQPPSQKKVLRRRPSVRHRHHWLPRSRQLEWLLYVTVVPISRNVRPKCRRRH